MATIALAAAGNALLPGAGQFVGAAIGAYIDNTFLFPAPSIKGPNLDGSRLGSASEGSPANFCLSKENRVAGTIIWMSTLRKHKEGGKGGSAARQDTYSIDLAIAFTKDIVINRIPKIFMNGKLVYNDTPDIDYSSNLLSAVHLIEVLQTGEATTLTKHYIEVTSPSTGPDLSQLRSGKNMIISGWTAAGNNGTWKVTSSTIDTTTLISKVRYQTSGGANESAGNTIVIHQDLPSFSPDQADSFTFYLGTETQLADPTIQAYEGVANTPAYRGTGCVVITDFQLQDYGNQLPQLIQATIEQTASNMNLSTAISTICLRSGLSSSFFDVSAITGTIRGYSIRGPQPLTMQLRPLLFAYDILTQEDNGVLRFLHRTNTELVTIDANDLRAHEDNSETDRPFRIQETSDKDLPSEVVVLYSDPNLDYQQGAQNDRKNEFSTDSPLQIDLGQLVLSPIDARTVARRLLWQAWCNKRRFFLNLPASYLNAIENDRMTVTYNGQTYTFLNKQVDRGANLLLNVEAVAEQSQLLTFANVTASNPDNFDNDIYVPPEMIFQMMDLAPLRDQELYTPGYYFAACAYDSELLFQGASLFESSDDANYTSILDVLVEATIGRCTTTLGSAVYPYWDLASSVTVEMYDGTLSSATQLDVLNGANRAVIGAEVIGFRTATQVNANTWTLTNLLRGLRNTYDKISGHAANELFVLLQDNQVYFRNISQSQINAYKYLKCVPLAGVVADYPSTQVRQQAFNLKPFAPVHLKATRSGTDITILWTRRTRALVRFLGGTFAPLAEQDERYEIDILNVAETVVLRTISVSAAQSTTYLGATQTTDGLVAGAALHLKIYQLSAIVGRGKATLAVV